MDIKHFIRCLALSSDMTTCLWWTVLMGTLQNETSLGRRWHLKLPGKHVRLCLEYHDQKSDGSLVLGKQFDTLRTLWKD